MIKHCLLKLLKVNFTKRVFSNLEKKNINPVNGSILQSFHLKHKINVFSKSLGWVFLKP